MSVATPARLAALKILRRVAERDAYARDLIDHSDAISALDDRDASFARKLVLGCVATQGCLDDALNVHLDKPAKLQLAVRCALRLSAFELIYLDADPHVAVDQGVELARATSKAATGLANAVLRKVATSRDAFLAAEDCRDETQRPLVAKARQAGLPVWLARRIQASLGEASADQLFQSQLLPAPNAACFTPEALGHVQDLDLVVAPGAPEPDVAGVHVHNAEGLETPGVHAPKQSEDAASASDDAKDIGHERSLTPCGPWLVRDMPKLLATGALARNEAVISDANAQRVAMMAVREGSCLEIGAGRGTKTFVINAHAKAQSLTREHVAVDLYETKCAQNQDRLQAAHLGDNVRTYAGDATNLDKVLGDLDKKAGERKLFDTVLLDAPCSGTGTMRRHPEIPWRLTTKDTDKDLPTLQLALLKEAATRVAPGGTLIYATCSVLKSENENVINKFMSEEREGKAFELKGSTQTIPAPTNFDGHYHAILKKAPSQ